MSCYEWESGTIKIPASEWADFKRRICHAQNIIISRSYTASLTAYDHIAAASKGLRKFNYRTALQSYLLRFDGNTIDSTIIHRAMFPTMERRKPLKPKKKDFPRSTNRTNFVNLPDATIELNNSTKTFRWEVEENNHAIEEAHKHPVAAAAFKALEQVSWKRNSGGVIIGNDEYNIDGGRDHYGGGGNYVTHAFGPLGRKLQTHPQGITPYPY